MIKRTKLGDPAFVDGVDEYQRRMLKDETTYGIRHKISDFHTQNVSAYDPEGFESLETYVTLANTNDRRLANCMDAYVDREPPMLIPPITRGWQFHSQRLSICISGAG